MNTLILIGAYGRRYATAEQALADWDNGKDFKIVNGPYCSIRDTEALKKDYRVCVIGFDNAGMVRVY